MVRDTQLLKGLLEREVTYGCKVVELLGNHGFREPQEATVYPILNRLEKKGLRRSEKKIFRTRTTQKILYADPKW